MKIDILKVVKKIISFLKKVEDALDEDLGEVEEDVVVPAEETPEPSPADATSAGGGSEKYEWKYGGFDGSKAVEDPAVQIGVLKVNENGMNYSWIKGNLREWGLEDTDASAIAAIGYTNDGKNFIVGKFDWISSSRTSRDFKNLKDGYGGWKWNDFWNSRGFGFCIVSKNGKKRTNWIYSSK